MKIDAAVLHEWFKFQPTTLTFPQLIAQRNLLEEDPGVREVLEPMVPDESRKERLDRDLQPALIIPPRDAILPITPASPEVLQSIEGIIDQYNESLSESEQCYVIDPKRKQEIIDRFLSTEPESGSSLSLTPPQQYRLHQSLEKASFIPFHDLIEDESLTLVHLIKCDIIFGIGLRYEQSYWDSILRYRNAHGGWLDLRDLAAAYFTLGRKPTIISQKFFYLSRKHTRWIQKYGDKWAPEEVWPYHAENLTYLKHIFFEDGDPTRKQKLGWRGTDTSLRISALKLLRLFPKPPKFFVPLLWEYALGTSSSVSGPARRCLENIENIEDQIIENLSSRTAIHRGEAARWLAELQVDRSIPLIKKALRKENGENAMIAMIDALAHLNVPEEEYLGREGLLLEAQGFVKKGVPEQMSWFPFREMPEVHWSDSGEIVHTDILTHFLLQGFRMKNPFPSALLKRYFDHMNVQERERFGQFVLEQWIGKDTRRRYSPEEEREYLMAKVMDYKKDATGENAERLMRQYERAEEFKHLMDSATKEKGILAVAAACCGSSAVPFIDKYLKTYYGWRPSQCKSLLSVLSWIEDYTATNLLITTSERFRTPSIRKEAEKLLLELSHRKGWTLDELSDRILPTGGFDENGELLISLGERRVTVHVTRDLKVQLFNEGGKLIKSLPTPRSEVDDEHVNDAKSQLSHAKKAVAHIRKLEKDRLYQAMCTQRTWTFHEWDTHLNRHPIMQYYCQRIVWSVISRDDDDRGEPLFSFRPRDDRTLRDFRGGEVHVNPEDTIRISHSLTLGKEPTAQWRVHLMSNRIVLILDQFPKNVYRLPSELNDAFHLEDFQGHAIIGYSLESAAKRLGYVRGPRQSAYFDRYEKKLLGCGFEIHIEFTGVDIPVMDEHVALKHAYFARPLEEGEDEWSVDQRKIPLGSVNPILISEGWNHLSAIAKKGYGFDPKWEKKYGT
jgi:hypothetical protein